MYIFSKLWQGDPFWIRYHVNMWHIVSISYLFVKNDLNIEIDKIKALIIDLIHSWYNVK